MELFQVKLIEQDNSRLIATSNYNYAITSPKLAPRNWRTVSVNGDKVSVTALNGEQQVMSRAALGEAGMLFIESLRDEVANSNGGYSHVSTASSGGGGSSGFMMSSNMGGSTSGGSSSSSSSYSTGGHQTSSLFGASGEMSYNMKDKDNFSVSRSDFPFGWSRVFFNGDLVTMIYRNGDVVMMPLTALEADKLDAINRIRNEVVEMQRTQSQQMSNTMQHSMDMISNVFNNIMGSFPKPPDYQSSVGPMFGNNFPFGPNNSPFSASSGYPFATGGGASAVAFAGRR